MNSLERGRRTKRISEEMTDFCKFPEDMVVHILSRLPPKSLIRFKCIHKSLHALIKNPKFVAKHLSNSMNNIHSPQYVLFKRFVFYIGDTSNIDKSNLFSKLDFCHDKDCDEHNNYSNVENVVTDPLSMHLEARSRNLELEILESGTFICQCHGMICLASSTSYHKLLLCNLATKEFKLETQTCLPLNPLECTNKSSVGFGYDPKSDNYKLVRLVCYGEKECDDGHIVIFPPRAEVHTLGTDSWQEISIGCLETESTIFWPMDFPFYFMGIFYWMGHEQQKEFESYYCKSEEEYLRGAIVFFDSCQEEFHNTLLPNILYEPLTFCNHMRFAVWNESLALFGFYSVDQRFEDTSIGIWVMDDIDGVKDSWTLKQSFRPPSISIQGTLDLWKSDEMIMVGPDDCMISYNFETKEIKHFPFESVWPQYFEILVTMNSLVFR